MTSMTHVTTGLVEGSHVWTVPIDWIGVTTGVKTGVLIEDRTEAILLTIKEGRPITLIIAGEGVWAEAEEDTTGNPRPEILIFHIWYLHSSPLLLFSIQEGMYVYLLILACLTFDYFTI